MLAPEAILSIFQKQAQQRAYLPGTPIFQEGEPAEFMYGLMQGEVELIRANRNGSPMTMSTVLPGEVFGVAAIIFPEIRLPVSAIAKTESLLALFNQDAFLSAIQSEPKFALVVMESSANFLADFYLRKPN